MNFKKTEKEIIKAIVKYGDNEKSLAEVLHHSKLLEKRGVAIIHHGGMNYVFLDKAQYNNDEENKGFGYIAELVSLVNLLLERRNIVLIPFASCSTDVIGIDGFASINPDIYTTDNGERICLEDRNVNWFDKDGEQKCWPSQFSENEMPLSHFFRCSFTVSQELKELVENGFKTDEQIRFLKQQRLTWISIAVTGLIGLVGLIIAVIGLLNS